MDRLIRHTDVQHRAGIRQCGCSSCLICLSQLKRSAGDMPSLESTSSAKAFWDSSTPFTRDTLSQRRQRQPAADELPRKSPRRVGYAYSTSLSDSSQRCPCSSENGKMSPKRFRSSCCFSSRDSLQVIAGVGVASDRVYLSDGYPQATAPSETVGNGGRVYLSDGYPQATAGPCA